LQDRIIFKTNSFLEVKEKYDNKYFGKTNKRGTVMDKLSRFRGALSGLAIGDALGTTIEFSRPGSFTPVNDITGGGPFELEPGQWTDDTSMALCLGESLIEEGFDPAAQMKRYIKWYKEGKFSVTGRCFDIGNTTRKALDRFIMTGEPFSGDTSESSLGNGSIMRLVPVPLYFCNNPALAIKMSGESSRTTHGHIIAIDACSYMGGLIVGAINGSTKDDLLSEHYSPVHNYWQEKPLTENISSIAAGSFKSKSPPEIKGTGYVVDSLEAALWAFYSTNNFKDGALAAVNLGDDADSTGAVYGQIAGAYYGIEGIPDNWVNIISHKDEWIFPLADKLFEKAINNKSGTKYSP